MLNGSKAKDDLLMCMDAIDAAALSPLHVGALTASLLRLMVLSRVPSNTNEIPSCICLQPRLMVLSRDLGNAKGYLCVHV